ncbi:MAG: hypothetical protein R2828_07710 [Saprospiraceae bacterium]
MEDKFDQIDKYIQNQLSQEERQAFEAALAEDPALAEEVRILTDFDTALGADDVLLLEGKIARIKQSKRQETPKPKAQNPWRTRLGVAAAILALIAMYFLMRPSGTTVPNSPAAIYAYTETQGWSAYPDEVFPEATDRGNNPGEPIGLEETINQTYRKGEYENTLLKLAEWQTQGPGRSNKYHYYCGIMQMQLAQYEAAKASFSAVEIGNYHDNARWNLAMAHLLSGDLESARQVLAQLLEENKKASSAKEVMQMIDQLR